MDRLLLELQGVEEDVAANNKKGKNIRAHPIFGSEIQYCSALLVASRSFHGLCSKVTESVPSHQRLLGLSAR